MQAPCCRAYGGPIDTAHILKMERDESIPCKTILYVPGEETPSLDRRATSTGRAFNAVANFLGEPLDMRLVELVFRGRRRNNAARRRGEHPG